MTASGEPTWGALFDDLENGLTLKTDEYFNRYLVNTDNPLAPFEPKDPKFFGPQVLNILIASKPYGWTFDGSENTYEWPPPGLAESLLKIREAFEQWDEFKLHIYGDRSLAAEIDDPELDDMLTQTFNDMEVMCLDNADIGFVWAGEIETLPDPSAFRDLIDEHYEHGDP